VFTEHFQSSRGVSCNTTVVCDYCTAGTQSIPLHVSAVSFRPVHTNDDSNTRQFADCRLEGFGELYWAGFVFGQREKYESGTVP